MYHISYYIGEYKNGPSSRSSADHVARGRAVDTVRSESISNGHGV